jgi:hypothetical protein
VPAIRPYVGSSIDELEQLFSRNVEDPDVLRDLRTELSHRNSGRASRLLSKVALELSKHGSEEETEEDLFGIQIQEEMPVGEPQRPAEEPVPRRSGQGAAEYSELPPDDRKRPAAPRRMRRPGTTGLPPAWVRKLSEEVTLALPRGAGLTERYVAALSALIVEIRKTGAGQKRYEIDVALRTESAGEMVLYACEFPEDGELFEEAKVDVQVRGKRVEGSIASITGGKLVLALKEDLGPRLEHVILLVDATALLEALKTKIEQVDKKELTFNRALADAVVGAAKPPPDPEAGDLPEPTASLNAPQKWAYTRALTKAISYIWGPPGCGKTWTLGEITRATLRRGERLLVCSNTNKAMDQILYKICENLGPQDEAMKAGHVVRVGQIADDKLAQDYREYVEVDGIADRLGAELRARRAELQRRIAELDARVSAAKELVQRYAALDKLEQSVVASQQVVTSLARQGKELQTKVEAAHAREKKLEEELRKRESAILKFLRRREEVIRGEIAASENLRARIAGDLRLLRSKYESAAGAFKAVQSERDSAVRRLAGTNLKAAENVVAEHESARAPFLAELREIASKLAQIRAEVLKNAKVLGATCTKAYLAAKDFGQFDMVLIDEASMVLLPAIWFAAGLAKKRVVVCGDFRQIPPIVQTQQQAIFDVLGIDVFEAVGLNDAKADDSRMVMLEEQHRMQDGICQLVSEPMYQGRLKTVGSIPRAPRPLPEPFDGPLTIVDTSDLWPFESTNAFFSRYNLMHSLLDRNLAWHFQKARCIKANTDLGICTPYAAQARLIGKLLRDEPYGELLQAGTVHRFQGDQRQTIVLDIPESHGGERRLGQFVQGVPPSHVGARLINVALSRAQNHLIVIANLTYLDSNLPSESLLRDVLSRMQWSGRVVSGSDLLRLRPIQDDLRGLIGKVELDKDATTFGIFNQHTFDAAVRQDIANARESVVILSGFITQSRVAALGDLLRHRLALGAKVRCVTRPPQTNGSMDPALSREALDALEGIGCTVDCRQQVHEKIVLIDKTIVWHGSLNMLSHTHRTDESMTRIVNREYAQAVAAQISKKLVSAERALNTIADAENPRCENCGSRSVFSRGRNGPYFYCEKECGWTADLRKASRSTRGPRRDEGKKEALRCPECGNAMRIREGRYGSFYGCTRYPECRGTVRIQ